MGGAVHIRTKLCCMNSTIQSSYNFTFSNYLRRCMTRSGVMRRKTHQKETTAPISDKRS